MSIPSKYGVPMYSPPGHRALPPPVAFGIPPPAPCPARRVLPLARRQRRRCADVSAAASGTLGFTGLVMVGSWMLLGNFDPVNDHECAGNSPRTEFGKLIVPSKFREKRVN